MALTNCGKVFVWGKGLRDMRVSQQDFFEPQNPFDQSRFKGLDLFFTKIASGSFHAVSVTSAGQIYMWGESTDGCLGRPPPENNPKQISLLPIEVDFFHDKFVHQVSCGERFTMVVVIDRKDQLLLNRRNNLENQGS